MNVLDVGIVVHVFLELIRDFTCRFDQLIFLELNVGAVRAFGIYWGHELLFIFIVACFRAINMHGLPVKSVDLVGIGLPPLCLFHPIGLVYLAREQAAVQGSNLFISRHHSEQVFH